MNDKKLNQIFAAARREPPPAVPDGFAGRVQRELARETRAEAPVINLWEHLNHRFVRYAVAAAATIVLCAAVEASQHFGSTPSMDDNVEQICSDWLMR